MTTGSDRIKPNSQFRIFPDHGALNEDYDWVDGPTVRVGGCDCCSGEYLLSALTEDELSIVHDALVLRARFVAGILAARRT